MLTALAQYGAISACQTKYSQPPPPGSRPQARSPPARPRKVSVAGYYGRRHSQLTVQAHLFPDEATHRRKSQSQRTAVRSLTVFGLPAVFSFQAKLLSLFCRHSACAGFPTSKSHLKENRTACCGCGLVCSHACQLSVSRSQ